MRLESGVPANCTGLGAIGISCCRFGAVVTWSAVAAGTCRDSTASAAFGAPVSVGSSTVYGSSRYRLLVTAKIAVGLEPGVNVELVTLRVCSPVALALFAAGGAVAWASSATLVLPLLFRL